jgi:hypothetical protein
LEKQPPPTNPNSGDPCFAPFMGSAETAVNMKVVPNLVNLVLSDGQ